MKFLVRLRTVLCADSEPERWKRWRGRRHRACQGSQADIRSTGRTKHSIYITESRYYGCVSRCGRYCDASILKCCDSIHNVHTDQVHVDLHVHADSPDDPPAWITMLAGGCGGAVSVCINNPIDVVKSRLQGSTGSQYSGTVQCFTWNGGYIFNGLAKRVPGLFLSQAAPVYHLREAPIHDFLKEIINFKIEATSNRPKLSSKNSFALPFRVVQ